MAADAFKSLGEKMDAAKEAEIAAYIMRDIELRQENAKEGGVLAYGRKPVPRGRPNERFLQNTLKSVSFANRKAAEDEMWEKWDKLRGDKKDRGDSWEGKKQRDIRARTTNGGVQGESRRRGRNDSLSADESASAETSSSSGLDSIDDSVGPRPQEIDDILTRGAVRGRGAVGSRADETGPFLFPTDEQEREEYEIMRYARKKIAGADCPDWVREKNENAASRVAVEGDGVRQKKSKKSKERKEKKKAKKLKKEKKRKRKERVSV